VIFYLDRATSPNFPIKFKRRGRLMRAATYDAMLPACASAHIIAMKGERFLP
jgi:hypothetical protein